VQTLISSKISVNERILQGLRRWRLLIYVAHCAAILLGVVTAILGVIIGPAVQALIRPDQEILQFRDLIGPVWSSWLSNVLNTDGIRALELYWFLPIFLAFIATVKALLTIFQWYTWEWLGEQLAYGWRQKMVESFVKLKPSRREYEDIIAAERELGGLMTQDIRTCRDYVVHFFGGLPREGMQALFMAISVSTLSPKLFFVFALCLAPIVAFLGRLGKKIRKRANRALEDNSVLGEWIQQRLLGIETIKQYGTESFEIGSMRLASANLYEGFLRATRLKSRTGPMIEVFGVLAICIAVGVAFFEIASGRISGAVAMSFFASLAIFAQSATKLGRYFNSNREGLAAADRIFRVIDQFDSAKLESVRSPDIFKKADQNALVLSNLCVNYGKKIAVELVSHRFLAGKIYCIVGASGAGKSSLFSAMLGLRDITSGSLNYELADKISPSQRLLISYMPQQVPTFPGTIAQNVAYPEQSIDLARVEAALAAVGWTMDQRRLNQGLKTRVGAGELQLSGGEAQRLQLARLIYHKSPFILIDEGTSALDPELEKQVLVQARELAKSGSVVIMIAHRPAATDFADELIVMDQGRFSKFGPRSEVITSSDFRRVFG
jgi:ABC-type multidrug transport system fused ATPase/permease subunit